MSHAGAMLAGMGRKSRQKRQRQAGAWTPGQGQLKAVRAFPNSPGEVERQRQDFVAGTVFADGAGILYPAGPPDPKFGPVFAVYVRNDASTYDPAPQLRELFGLLDQHGGARLHEMSRIGTSWAVLDGREPLAKLKLEFHEPVSGPGAGIVLLAENYRDHWRHIVAGGVIAITTAGRLERATSAPGASFADGLDACIVLGIRSSPGIEHLMAMHGWPR
jgi:hypothetical protein